MNGNQMHHIVFRSQGGLDFPLNLIGLTPLEHTGAGGPHRNRKTDLIYKIDLQNRLYEIFRDEKYTIEEIAKKLGRPNAIKYFTRNFKAVPSAAGVYQKEDIIRRLMGGKIY